GHLGALGERTEALALDRLVMDEEVRAGLIGGDEAEALLIAEPLHGSCCHVAFPPRDVWCCETRRVLLRQRLRDAGTSRPGAVVPAVPFTLAQCAYSDGVGPPTSRSVRSPSPAGCSPSGVWAWPPSSPCPMRSPSSWEPPVWGVVASSSRSA